MTIVDPERTRIDALRPSWATSDIQPSVVAHGPSGIVHEWIREFCPLAGVSVALRREDLFDVDGLHVGEASLALSMGDDTQCFTAGDARLLATALVAAAESLGGSL